MYNLTTLPNQLRLLTIPMPGAQSVTVLVLVAAGSRFEPAAKAGLSHFLEHMFFKGTKKRPRPEQIAETIDALGGEISAYTAKDHAGYFAQVAARHLEIPLELFADILNRSTFPVKEIEKEKGTILEEMKLYEDTPFWLAPRVFGELLYGQSNLGRRIIGTPQTLRDLAQADFKNYLSARYRPNNIVLGVAGRLDPQKVQVLVQKYFGQMAEKTVENFSPVEIKQTRPQVKILHKKTQQAHLILGFRGLAREDPDRYALSIINAVLGANMSSRLFVQVRERRGLAYYIKTGADAYAETGSFAASAGCDLKKVEETVKVILGEFNQLAQKGVTARELAKAKEYLKGKLALELEDSESVAGFYSAQALLEKEIKTPNEIISRFEAVANTHIKQLARKLFISNNLNLALIGPFKNKEKFAKILTI